MANTSSRSKAPMLPLVLIGLFSFLGFLLFAGLVLVMLNGGNRRPTFEMKRAAERFEKLKIYQAKNKELLETYGWANESAGIARIPIERAMELTIQDLAKKEVKAAGPVNPPAQPAKAPEPAPAAATEKKPAPEAPSPK